jgi:beta-glucosidase
MTHQAVMDFFKTGEFRFQIPLLANYTYSEPNIRDKFDYFGVQYYSDPLIGMEFSSQVMASTCYPNEKMTDMDYRFYPEGLATALEECRLLGKPIFVTETGIAGKTEEDRVEFFEKIFEVVSRAIESGIKVKELFVWSLEDNYEWAEGWNKHFGLYSFDHITGEFALRDVGKWIQELNQRLPQEQEEIA